MRKIIVLLHCIFPMYVYAQSDLGIYFRNFDSFGQLLHQARIENKSVFIDAFATWCVPCRKMDNEVYTIKEIGELMNSNFISVRVQFDRTNKDNNAIRRWYSDANALSEKYHINAFPTFIFLNSSGEILLKDVGFKDEQEFKNLIQLASDSKRNYSSLLNSFKLGTIKKEELLSLSLKVKEYDDTLALEIARRYKSEVLDRDDPSTTINKEVGDFMTQFQQLFTVRDKSVIFLLDSSKQADDLLAEHKFAQRFTDYLITKTEIDPIVRPLGVYAPIEPDWLKIEINLNHNYDSLITRRLIAHAKSDWYINRKEWSNAVKYTLEYLEVQGIDTSLWAASVVNGILYDIVFKHTDEFIYLKKSIGFMETILKAHPAHYPWIDTYANILYKIGEKDRAISEEQRALVLARAKNDTSRSKIFEEVLTKMRSQKPTW